MIHPDDVTKNNPRLQCCVCGQWKRLHMAKRDMSPGGYERSQRFFGACAYTEGDHPAGKGPNQDVCDDCCHKECRRLAGFPPLEL